MISLKVRKHKQFMYIKKEILLIKNIRSSGSYGAVAMILNALCLYIIYIYFISVK